MFNSHCFRCSITLVMNINMDTTPYAAPISAQQINSNGVALFHLQSPRTDEGTATYCSIVPTQQVK
jgi:hypothetical protein